jgi:nitrous oxidase accessory protein NosD
MVVTTDTTLEPGIYLLPKGISIGADNITLDCSEAMLIGANREGTGITCEGHTGVTIKGARIREYYQGIRCVDCENLTITGNQVTSTAGVPDNTSFLNIMAPPEESYGGGVFLWKVRSSKVEDNELTRQMAGILTYECEKLEVRRNNTDYNSGFGIHLWATCDSVFEDNYADYCCRWNKRAEAVGHAQTGHMGSYAAGFLAVKGSNRNVFRRNFARLGGDGFFVTGCHDNLFEENDGSLSPNIAFECTFGSGNVFRNNRADRCNFGFWLGWSWNTTIEGTRMVHNRQAGIACDHGHDFTVRNNEFHSNLHGILLWGMMFDPTDHAYPDHLTSFNWTIEDNSFIRNGNGTYLLP